MKHKKGDIALGRLAILLGVIFSFLAILALIHVFTTVSESKSEEQACHASIVARTSSRINVNQARINLVPPLCKTIDKKIGGSREEIKSQLAQMMARCWWMFNEGRQDDLFADNSDVLIELLGFDADGNKCFLCYTAAIDQDEIEGTSYFGGERVEGIISAEEMFDYLMEKNHPQIAGITYVDYIQSYGGPGKVAVFNNIVPNHAYGVVYLSKSENTGEVSWGDVVAQVTAVVAIAVGGALCLTGVGCSVGAFLIAGGVAQTVRAYAIIFDNAIYTEERDVSMVTLDSLDNIRHNGCLVSDLSGE